MTDRTSNLGSARGALADRRTRSASPPRGVASRSCREPTGTQPKQSVRQVQSASTVRENNYNNTCKDVLLSTRQRSFVALATESTQSAESTQSTGLLIAESEFEPVCADQ
uniref:Uncharacterized protein n=1 Tax=Heliothis virescens TaxID=7102 RepID=A0A2A4JBX7_HELVI